MRISDWSSDVCSSDLDSILRTGQEPQRSISLRSAQGTSMPRQLISSGSPFEAQVGYSRAVVQGDWCFVAGTTGTDPETKAMPESVVEIGRASCRERVCQYV